MKALKLLRLNLVILKHYLQNFIFIIIIGVLGYISLTLYKDNNSEEESSVSPYPLFIVKDYDLVRFDENGKKAYSMIGPEMEHYDDERGSKFDDPFLTHYTEEGLKDWTAKSDSAKSNSDQSLIVMNDDVVLTKFDKDNAETTTILNTSQLFVHNKGEKVTNDVWTKIRNYPNNTIEGIGLLGFPKTGQFNLSKDVKSYYETIKD